MKHLGTFFVLALLSFTSFSLSNPEVLEKSNPDAGDSSFSGGNRTYTLELAEAMPADKYTFRPTDSVRSFGEQLAHIALSTQFLMNIFVDGKPMPSAEDFAATAKMEKEIGADKEKCIAMLKKAFDALDAKYASMSKDQLNETFKVAFDPNSPEFPKSKAFDMTMDHLTHHRAQALVALRMQEIPAPAYRLY